MNPQIAGIKERIEPLRQAIIQHKVYAAIKSIDDLRIFMEHHVYAVWDFMSLLKALQNKLTSTSIPWFPVGSADTRFLINEIVVGEESDVDQHGRRISHFELYLEAMRQSGADCTGIESFIAMLQAGEDLQTAYDKAAIPGAASAFIDFTFDIIHSQKAHLQSAVFTFGREDLIPDMFLSIIQELHEQSPEAISIFKYYIERHIEVDGGHHSHLALQMTAQLCGDDPEKWLEAEEAIVKSLHQRQQLWDAVHDALKQDRATSVTAEVFASL
jgi:hypothetical protein